MSLGVPRSERQKFFQQFLKSSPPPISEKPSKYADHPPPNAGHGFAALRKMDYFLQVFTIAYTLTAYSSIKLYKLG